MNQAFKAEIQDFYDDISNRNREALLKFLDFDANEDFDSNIASHGSIKTVQGYWDSQQHWYDGNTGYFRAEVIEAEVEGDYGKAVAMAEYSNIDEDGKKFLWKIRIELGFRRKASQWYLVRNFNYVLDRRAHHG